MSSNVNDYGGTQIQGGGFPNDNFGDNDRGDNNASNVESHMANVRRGDTYDQGLRPLTIKQIINAQIPAPDQAFQIDGKEISNMTIVARIINISPEATHTTYTLDDGTGRIDVTVWASDGRDLMSNNDDLKRNIYVRVIGRIRIFQNRKAINAYTIKPIEESDEITNHCLEVIYTHEVNLMLLDEMASPQVRKVFERMKKEKTQQNLNRNIIQNMNQNNNNNDNNNNSNNNGNNNNNSNNNFNRNFNNNNNNNSNNNSNANNINNYFGNNSNNNNNNNNNRSGSNSNRMGFGNNKNNNNNNNNNNLFGNNSNNDTVMSGQRGGSGAGGMYSGNQSSQMRSASNNKNTNNNSSSNSNNNFQNRNPNMNFNSPNRNNNNNPSQQPMSGAIASGNASGNANNLSNFAGSNLSPQRNNNNNNNNGGNIGGNNSSNDQMANLVLQYIAANQPSDDTQGIPIDTINQNFATQGVSTIKQALKILENDGRIYSTSDETEYRVTG